MGTPNILLTRIDNRLVHGQVGVTWTTTLGANLIIVADDEVAENTLQQQLMEVTAQSSGAGVRFFTLQKTIDVIHKAAEHQKIFIVVKTPKEVRKLIEGGVPIKEVNVGNMHFDKGKTQISKKVYVDDKDMEDLRAIKDMGIDIYIQDVPGGMKERIN
ncbi:PTS galactosamine transporter subunit IIB [Clostridium beijerinckii]|uniref:PTS galactosamine transporter subunit IIB n=1 Tax=Clostridium beijerinckii TaxID=1520 RepID=UPI0002E8DD50|nr:PTS galactosamine transporter subunit IIB [Clostridium beijerinckii]